jgi:zinc transport system ATP-binding protein
MKLALEVKNLTVKYPRYTHAAVEDVSFSVALNTIAALIGPNGSGKTTVIKAILGLIEYEGEIKVFDKPVEEMYQKVGFVPQRFSFDPTFPITVYEFIFLVLSGISDRKSVRQINQALDYVDANDLAKRKLSSLSGGQLQRVLLARALVKNPTLLLLDEPEAGVDVGGEQTFYDLMEKLVEDKKVTALIASHELDVVYTYAQQVICVNQRMLCSGEPREVLDQETFEKLYGRGLRFYGHDHASHKKNKKAKHG